MLHDRRANATLGPLSALIISGPVFAIFKIITWFYAFGPFICIALASWRLRHRDYRGSSKGETTLANLTPALDFFYTLVLCQGVLYIFLNCLIEIEYQDASLLREQSSVEGYLDDTRERFKRDPALAEGRSLLSYAVALLESESHEDCLIGARMLDRLINDGEDAGNIILRSRPKLQRLLDMLGWVTSSSRVSKSDGNSADIREFAARIVAHLADGTHLAQFPGAIRSVSSLLETSGQPYWNINKHELSPSEGSRQQGRVHRLEEEMDKSNNFFRKIYLMLKQVNAIHKDNEERERDRVEQELEASHRGGCNELVLQGIRILERLACDPHNCRDICGYPGLLAKITAPLYSATLIEVVGRSEAWAEVAIVSLKVVHRFIHVAPGKSSRRLRHGIFSNRHALRNEQLQVPAMEILTELVMDSAINITMETRAKLIRKQLQIFLADGWGEELKATAGEALSILSKNEAISEFIVRKQDDIVDRLTRMLYSKEIR